MPTLCYCTVDERQCHLLMEQGYFKRQVRELNTRAVTDFQWGRFFKFCRSKLLSIFLNYCIKSKEYRSLKISWFSDFFCLDRCIIFVTSSIWSVTEVPQISNPIYCLLYTQVGWPLQKREHHFDVESVVKVPELSYW